MFSVAFKNRAALIVRTATASPRHGRAALPRSSTRLTFAEKQSHVQYDNRNMTLHSSVVANRVNTAPFQVRRVLEPHPPSWCECKGRRCGAPRRQREFRLRQLLSEDSKEPRNWEPP